MTTQQQGNDYILSRIENRIPTAIGKIGGVEGEALIIFWTNYCNKFLTYWGDWVCPLYVNAGVYPISDDIFNRYCVDTLNILPSMDLLADWQPMQTNLIRERCPSAILTELRALEPFYHSTPWTHALLNKKVLLISPFTESSKTQYERKRLVWPNELLPDFELLTIQSPYSKALNENTKYSDWFEALHWMKEEMNKVDFDVAIIGAGAYSLHLATHAKSLGKIGIHTGGGTQIIFGIKGKRWDNHPDISKFFNEWWVRPALSENPPFKNLIGDGDTYW
jgi:hypothetical protein